MNYINEVAKNIKLKESKKVIEQFLIYLYINGSLSTKALAHKLLLPIPVVTAMKKEFLSLRLVVQKSGVGLSDSGVKYVESKMKYSGIDINLYRSLLSDEDFKLRYMDKLTEQISPIYESRPQVNVALDQALCTTETAVKRALLCLENFSLIGKNILCVGDDDLVSIALSFLLKDLFPDSDDKKASIVVFDVDERLTDYITDISSTNHFPIHCRLVNLKEPLPLKFLNSFDCFFTDPPYTIEGLILFLSRGISALKKEKGSSIFLSFGQKPIEDTFQMQKEILNHGLSIKKIMDSFNEYNGASLLGNRSQMIVLESTESTKTLIASEAEYDKPIYTREINQLEREYRCKNCGNIILLSTQNNSQVNTIEQLKQSGCPECGGTNFDLLNKNSPVRMLEKKKALGVHIIADFFDCSEEVLRNRDLVEEYMYEAARKANATIVFGEFHSFNPWGISGAIIIKESHLTIHTWPEYRYAAVDLFTCGSSLELMDALKYLKVKFECSNIEYSNLARGLFQNNHIESTITVENNKI